MAKIVRVFHAEVKAGMEEEFRKFFVHEAVPLVKAHRGIVSVLVGLPQSRSPRSFLMISTWSGPEALEGFAGPEWTEAVIDPREEHLLERVSVSHYVELDS
jgi:quinol monooxygenase YgiN